MGPKTSYINQNFHLHFKTTTFLLNILYAEILIAINFIILYVQLQLLPQAIS